MLINEISDAAISRLEQIFEDGKGLRSTPLKRYSGPALERVGLNMLCL